MAEINNLEVTSSFVSNTEATAVDIAPWDEDDLDTLANEIHQGLQNLDPSQEVHVTSNLYTERLPAGLTPEVVEAVHQHDAAFLRTFQQATGEAVIRFVTEGGDQRIDDKVVNIGVGAGRGEVAWVGVEIGGDNLPRIERAAYERSGESICDWLSERHNAELELILQGRAISNMDV